MTLKSNYLLLLLFTFLTHVLQAQQPAWYEVQSPYLNSYSSQTISALTNDASGNVYAAIGNNVYKWTPPGWLPLGTGGAGLNANYPAGVLAADGAGNLYAAGAFTNTSGKCYVAKWNGSTWSEVGTLDATGPVQALALDAQGNLYAAGWFLNNTGHRYVAKWNGTAWSEVGSGAASVSFNDQISALAVDAGNLYAAGGFTNATGKRYVAKWNGSVWSEVGGSAGSLSANSYIRSLAVDAAGRIYASGQFTNSANENYVAYFNGNSWAEVGSGTAALHANYWINTLKILNGQLYAAGSFTNSQGQNYVARWDGNQWSTLGNPATLKFNSSVYSLAADAAGSVYAAGNFTNAAGNHYVATFSSTTGWTEAGYPGTGQLSGNGVLSLITDRAGNLYAGGFLGNVMKWNGQYWSAVGGPVAPLNANGNIEILATDRFGNIYAAGGFTNGSGKIYVAKWDGTTWSEVGNAGSRFYPNGSVLSLAVDSFGNLYAGGYFKNAGGNYYIAKWNGNAWSEMLAGGTTFLQTSPVYCLAVDRQNRLYASAFRYTNSPYHCISRWDGNAWTDLFDPTNPLRSDDPIASFVLDSSDNVYALADGVDQTGFVHYVSRWNGTTWRAVQPVYGFGYVNKLVAPGDGNVYFCGDNRLRRWDGSQMQTLALSGGYREVSTVAVAGGVVYGAGFSSFPFLVGKLNFLALPQPIVYNVTQQCSTNPTAKAKVINPPYNGVITVEQDGQQVAYNAADSSFVYYAQGQTATGRHAVRLKFSNAANVSQTDTAFTLAATVTPSILLNGSSVITPGQPTVVSTAIANGGNTPGYLWQDSTAQHNWVSVAGGSGASISYPAQVGTALRCWLTSNAPCATVSSVVSPTLRFDAVTALQTPNPGDVSFVVWPNPVRNTVIAGPFAQPNVWTQYRLCDSYGRVLLQGKLQRQQRQLILTVQSFPAGTYWLSLSNGQLKEEVRMIVKE